MLGNLAIPHAHDIHGLELNFAARRHHAQEFSLVGPVICLVRGHAVAIGNLPVYFSVKVGERCPESFVELTRAAFIGCTAGLWRMVEKVICEELLEYFEIPAALNFLGVAAHDRLGGLTHIIGPHGVSSSYWCLRSAPGISSAW